MHSDGMHGSNQERMVPKGNQEDDKSTKRTNQVKEQVWETSVPSHFGSVASQKQR